MAPPKRVILDSEDDDSDFEDSAGGDNDHQPEEEPTEEEPRHETIIRDTGTNTNTASTSETDPSFFQRVYDETVAAMHPSAATTGDSGANAPLETLIPDTLPPTAGISSESVSFIPDTLPPTAGQRRADAADDEPTPSSFPSPSNPMAQTRKSGRARTKTQIAADTIDLTTPRKPAGDVWDVPSSFPGAENTGAGESAKSTRSAGGNKRNRTTEAAEDPYEFPAAATPAPARKRAKRGTQTSPLSNDADSSPVVLVPTETPGTVRRSGRARGMNNNNNTADLESSTTQLYVAQSELTTSQKQEYMVVDISSPNVPQPTLPTQPHGFAEVHKSSGATVSTIQYTTPSRLGSSRREMPSTAGPGEVSTEEVQVQETEEQQSSPDVLNEVPVSTSAKRGRRKAATSSSAANSSSAPRASKKRKVVYASDDDVDGLEGAHEEEAAWEPQEQAFVPEPESEPVAVEPPVAAPALEEPPSKKKRGRKKKETVTEPAVQPAEPPVEQQAADSVEPEEPPSKKRRGRPRKSDTAKPQASESIMPSTEPDVEDIEKEPTPAPLAEVSRNSKRGKKAKEAEEEEEEEEAYDPKAEEIEENKDQEMPKEKTEKVAVGPAPVIKVKDEKPAVKSAAAAIAATTKVKYRVGLSKRSRIAPLLKSLKKP